MKIHYKGKPSLTKWEVLESWRSRHALIAAFPRTGRTHQVRIHLAANSTPIACDPVYGNGLPLLLSSLKRGYVGKDSEKPLIKRTALHCSRIEFRHPVSGGPVEFLSPLPHDMELALKMLRKWA